MIKKQLLVADRVRHVPREGFSWIDRRFVREYAQRLSGDAIALYFFLAAVSDKQGLSFYSDASIARQIAERLRRGGWRAVKNNNTPMLGVHARERAATRVLLSTSHAPESVDAAPYPDAPRLTSIYRLSIHRETIHVHVLNQRFFHSLENQ